MGKKGIFGIDLDDFQDAMNNWKKVEPLIQKSVEKESYFEAILLIHQNLELLLRIMFTFKTNLLNVAMDPIVIKGRTPRQAELRNNILAGNPYSYALFNQLDFLCGCYDEGLYERLSKYNSFRNDMVHGFLKGKIKHEDLKLKISEGVELTEIINAVLQTNNSKDAAIVKRLLDAEIALAHHLFDPPK